MEVGGRWRETGGPELGGGRGGGGINKIKRRVNCS